MDLVARTNRGLMNIYAYKSHTDRLLDLRVGYFNESRFARDEGFKNAFIFASLKDGDYLLAVDDDGQTVTNVGCYLYDFRATDPDYYRLTTPFTGAVTLLFSTFNGVVGLPPEWQDATPVNAPAGARDDVNLFAGTGQEFTRSVTDITQLIGPTFDGVLWAYAIDGVWYYVDKGKPSFDGYAYRLNGTGQYWQLDQKFIDVNNLAGTEIEFWADASTLGHIVSQTSELVAAADKEFEIYSFSPASVLSITVGGQSATIDTKFGFLKHKISFIDDTTIHYDYGEGVVVYSYVIGGKREPAINTTIGSATGGGYKSGIIKNVKITRNNTAILDLPLTDIDQGATQLDLVAGHPATAIAYNEDNWEQQLDSTAVFITQYQFDGRGGR